MTQIRILLADDHAKVRSALRLLLEQEPIALIVGEAADATALLQATEAKRPDVVLLDWELPGLPSEQLLRLLRFERPSLKVVAMSSRPEARNDASHAGVDSFISKGERPDRVLSSLRDYFRQMQQTASR